MDLYAAGNAAEIRYPSGQSDAQHLAEEFAARLDDLVDVSASPFSAMVAAGVPTTDVEAVFIGREQDWASEVGLANVPWWVDGNDFAVKVVSGSDCLNTGCTGSELHIVARDNPLLLRAAWMALHGLGWRHYMPNGVEGLEDLWVSMNKRDTITTNVDRVWTGAIDHLLPSIAGRTSNLGWSDGTDHGSLRDGDGNILYPDGQQEGDLSGAIGESPSIEPDPDGTWLRHMGWTTSSDLQTNSAWTAVIAYDETHDHTLSVWDETTLTGHYTAQTTPTSHKLYTDDADVRRAALDYANDKVARLGLDWVSLSRPDGDWDWEIFFNDPAFEAKLPVRRQIELANHVATSADYIATGGTGIVIQAYGDTAEPPTDDVWPDPDAVCVIVIEAYRPPGRTTEQIIDDYVVDDGTGNLTARCPMGVYQYLYSSAWGQGIITAPVGSPTELVERANRVKYLAERTTNVSPRVLTGEAMTDFGFYGLGYYGYMQMVLDVGRVAADFTLDDFHRHRRRFMRDLFPTEAVRRPIGSWYKLLFDLEHKPLLSAHLVRCLWDELEAAMAAVAAGGTEEKRVAELGKYTRFLDLRNQFEAAAAAGLDAEPAYDAMMEWLFRIRDSGLVDVFSLFQFPLDRDVHDALGLGLIWDALNEPPGGGRGSNSDRPAWITTAPSVEEFTDPVTNWISVGQADNDKHGLTDTAFTDALEGGWVTDSRERQDDTALQPYRAKNKMKLWLIPGDSTFECAYEVGDGGAYVEFVNQATGDVDAEFPVTADGTIAASLTAGQLYQIRLTTYATGDQMCLDWWTGSGIRHFVSFDPGREGDPCGFGGGTSLGRSYYFLVPDGVAEIHFYASVVDNLQLFYLDNLGVEQEDTTFAPLPRAYQSHPVDGTGRRVLRIAGIKINEIGFWLLNCPNLFALHPEELLKPSDA
jgi:hypothetical protein